MRSSTSVKSTPIRSASIRPTVDLPAPGGPTSTTAGPCASLTGDSVVGFTVPVAQPTLHWVPCHAAAARRSRMRALNREGTMAIMLRRRVGLALTSAATPGPTDKGGGTTSCTAVEEQVAIAGNYGGSTTGRCGL